MTIPKADIKKVIIGIAIFFILILLLIRAYNNAQLIFHARQLVVLAVIISLIPSIFLCKLLIKNVYELFDKFMICCGTIMTAAVIFAILSLCLNNIIAKDNGLKNYDLKVFDPEYSYSTNSKDKTSKSLIAYDFTIINKNRLVKFHINSSELPNIKENRIRLNTANGLFGFTYLVH